MIDTVTGPLVGFSHLISRYGHYLLSLSHVKLGVSDLSLDALVDIAAAMLIYVVVY